MRVKINKKMQRSMSGQCLIEKLEGRVLLSASSAGVSATFVPNLYRGLLGREGSSVEVASWEAKLSDATHPMTPAQVAAGFLSSTEYRTGMVQVYYRTLLGRTVETEGLNHWTNELSADKAPETVVAEIVGTPEYATKNGGTTTGIIHQLYVDFLGRQADDAGAAHWENQVAQGETITQVADAMLHSSESRQWVVNYYYERYLNRKAEPMGLANWVTRMNAEGGNQTVVLSGILGAPEFYESQDAWSLVQTTPTTSTGASGSTLSAGWINGEGHIGLYPRGGTLIVRGADIKSTTIIDDYKKLWEPAYIPTEIWTATGSIVQNVHPAIQQDPLFSDLSFHAVLEAQKAIAVG